ncbi:PhoX family protein [Nocardia donostiensis]|uniref:Phosphatase n=1 Tax=Nocardia donostiensis TaxID=1538463 RepID=A0A1W0B9J2_9NOCA|nr:PhoX family phosphatase [Nocardia donostiensis]ONM46616.1 phosphatase [Nocardia donostiensis]OQS12354.1 phosphatase [Nocardia donostiensis]OQS19056.1 phosphatase [Nocardia donostiensis]
MSPKPLTLYVQHQADSARAAVTCAYKCGNACFHEAPNTSSGAYFGDIVADLSRRRVLQGGAAAVLAIGAASVLAACGDGAGAGSVGGGQPGAGTDFTPVVPNTEDAVVVPEGYEQGVVIRWGDPLFADAPEFDARKQTPAAQLKQFGYNNDFAGLLPIEGQTDRYLLVVNHEYTTEPFMFPGFAPEAMTREQFEITIAAHGLSVVEVEGEAGSGKLTPVFGKYNRRITAASEFRLTGPAAGSDLLKTSADPTGTTVAGTFANCSGGVTPWGTVLSGEENFNGYFAGRAADERMKRYGVGEIDSPHYWERFDKRFDLAQEPNEANRFGWVVEIDPWDPNSVPVKHTALGRFKHEAANIYVTDDGTVVAYSGDDERFEYMYKFVSSRKMQPGMGAASRRHNLTILDAGTLYVAKLTGDHPDRIDGSGRPTSDQGFTGTGQWIPILRANEDGTAESLVDGMTADQVAIFTRLAGDKVGATKMDRPEDFEANPKTGKVYVALTNNSKRGTEGKAAADEANPRNQNKNGQVLELVDDHAGTEFNWSLLLVCGDPAAADTYYGGFDKTQVSPISCPDNVAFDGYGNLWISTDGNALGTNDGLFSVTLDGDRRGETKQFLTVPAGGETCGPVITEQRVLVCVQHPGEIDGASADRPASHWPDGGDSMPRPAVVAVWKAGGGRIGV